LRRQVASHPFSLASSATSGQFGNASPLEARKASRSPVVIAWPVRSPTCRRRLRVAARQAVAAVLVRELDAVLLEPVDRARSLAGEHLDEVPVGRLVGALPDVLGVLLR